MRGSFAAVAALAGSVAAGVQQPQRRQGSMIFRVPIDPSAESVAFSVSVQCLEAAYVLDPSGALVGGDDVTDLSNFRAERMSESSTPCGCESPVDSHRCRSRS